MSFARERNIGDTELTQLKQIKVVAGLIFRGGKVLACQRKEGGPFSFKWEFPGGKVEIGEAHTVALRRELREELGIDAGQCAEVFQHRHLYPGLEVHLRFYRVRDFKGDVKNLVFQKIVWVSADELKTLDFLAGDYPVIEFLCSAKGVSLFL